MNRMADNLNSIRIDGASVSRAGACAVGKTSTPKTTTKTVE
ncbi:MAG: hypothetical protein OQJ99_10055 [Rhodospirillales bacterium]|nr:hypothetical protein [Rhodospirillales bacterium]MCW8861597.1 hypothetical protein [Rhodospirillales bacterium]MCW8951258.1 hypothetical protein [Rhodospirillales bacterium]MCW8971631.1 hypothetical protein [Rhodospirillales bacterium]MCW9002510.1 hypothetical protein [Rhodospirillales bacterium]